MAEKYLQSEALGTWTYEIEEGKTKVKYHIRPGLNLIPDSHFKTLDEDPGYKARLKQKVYKILNQKKGAALANSDNEEIEKAADEKAAKDSYKQKIEELKKEHSEEMKSVKADFKSQIQQLTDSRGEALQKVKDLEAEKKSLKIDLADFEAKKQKDIETLEKKIEDLEEEKKKLNLKINGLEKEVKDLKVKK